MQIQHQVGGKALVHQAAALHFMQIKIRSQFPSPPLSPPQPHNDKWNCCFIAFCCIWNSLF